MPLSGEKNSFYFFLMILCERAMEFIRVRALFWRDVRALFDAFVLLRARVQWWHCGGALYGVGTHSYERAAVVP